MMPGTPDAWLPRNRAFTMPGHPRCPPPAMPDPRAIGQSRCRAPMMPGLPRYRVAPSHARRNASVPAVPPSPPRHWASRCPATRDARVAPSHARRNASVPAVPPSPPPLGIAMSGHPRCPATRDARVAPSHARRNASVPAVPPSPPRHWASRCPATRDARPPPRCPGSAEPRSAECLDTRGPAVAPAALANPGPATRAPASGERIPRHPCDQYHHQPHEQLADERRAAAQRQARTHH